MGEVNKNKFLELYDKLPISMKDFFASDKMGVIIDDALNLGKVSSEKFSSVMDIIEEILFLQLPKEQFRNELEKRVNITPISAEIIDKIINNEIFEQFSTELEQYKYSGAKKPIEFREPFEIPEEEVIKTDKIKELVQRQKPLEAAKIEDSTPQIPKQSFPEKNVLEQPLPEQTSFKKPPLEQPLPKQPFPGQTLPEQPLPKQPSPEQPLPEYSFPEPPEIKVEKPISKMGGLKKVISPKIPSEQQEKIRQRLLEVMQKKDASPKIVEEMKKVSLKKPTSNEVKKEEEKPSRKKIIEEAIPSEVLTGEGKKFKDEESPLKTKEEKPYILDVKLKEEKRKKEETPAPQEPIRYKKYQKDSPFGEA